MGTAVERENSTAPLQKRREEGDTVTSTRTSEPELEQPCTVREEKRREEGDTITSTRKSEPE